MYTTLTAPCELRCCMCMILYMIVFYGPRTRAKCRDYGMPGGPNCWIIVCTVTVDSPGNHGMAPDSGRTSRKVCCNLGGPMRRASTHFKFLSIFVCPADLRTRTESLDCVCVIHECTCTCICMIAVSVLTCFCFWSSDCCCWLLVLFRLEGVFPLPVYALPLRACKVCMATHPNHPYQTRLVY